MTSSTGMDVGHGPLYGGLFIILHVFLNFSPFDCTTISGSREVEPLNLSVTTPDG